MAATAREGDSAEKKKKKGKLPNNKSQHISDWSAVGERKRERWRKEKVGPARGQQHTKRRRWRYYAHAFLAFDYTDLSLIFHITLVSQGPFGEWV